MTIEAAEGRELGFSVEMQDGKYYRTDYPTMTDGKGDKLRKNAKFCCIATGNTNMKENSLNFSGNNRQDYSLVDRFAGSFYYIDYNHALEQKLTYDTVYKVATMIRNVLDADKNLIESVSLRTMLNFNRIYEQEGLRKLKSKYAIEPIIVNGRPMAKTFKDSVNSFVTTLPDATQDVIKKTDVETLASADIIIDEFIEQWHKMYGAEISPEVGTAKWK
jgi:cobaltochelatase CobS